MSKLKPFISRRGDTIIEVTFCFVVFILVSAISVSMMNRSYAKIQNSLKLMPKPRLCVLFMSPIFLSVL